MTTLEQASKAGLKTEKAIKAIEAINNGAKFNGVIYGKNHRNGTETDLSVYVGGDCITLGRVWKKDSEAIKDLLLEMIESTSTVSVINNKETLPSGRFGQGNYEYGTENWLYSGMNGE